MTDKLVFAPVGSKHIIAKLTKRIVEYDTADATRIDEGLREKIQVHTFLTLGEARAVLDALARAIGDLALLESERERERENENGGGVPAPGTGTGTSTGAPTPQPSAGVPRVSHIVPAAASIHAIPRASPTTPYAPDPITPIQIRKEP